MPDGSSIAELWRLTIWVTTPDRNLVLLTAGLREDLAQLVWAMQDAAGTDGDRPLVVLT